MNFHEKTVFRNLPPKNLVPQCFYIKFRFRCSRRSHFNLTIQRCLFLIESLHLEKNPHVEFQQRITDNPIPRLDLAMTCLAQYAASLRPAEEGKCMMASKVEKTMSCDGEDSNVVSSTISFPMFTLPSLAFMKMSHIQPHEDLMETCFRFKAFFLTFEFQTLLIVIARNVGSMKN